MKTKIIIFAIVLLGITQFRLTAQNLHVTFITPNVQSPYLTDLYNMRSLFNLQITNAINKPVKVKLDARITYNGEVVITSPWTQSKVIEVKPGSNIFNFEDIVTFGAIKYTNFVNTALRTGMIKAGHYEACIKLFDAISNKEIHPDVCKGNSITSFQAPILLMPANGTEISSNSYPIFKWTAVSPFYKGSLAYNVRVFEVLKGQTPMMALQSNRPLVDEFTTSLQMIWPFSINLESGNYIWMVKAINVDGKEVGEPNNFAQPFTFKVIKRFDNTLINGKLDSVPFNVKPKSVKPQKKLIVLNGYSDTNKTRDTASNIKYVPINDFLFENGYYPNKNLIETIIFLNKENISKNAALSPDSLVLPDKILASRINKDYKKGLKKYNEEKNNKNQNVFDMFSISISALDRHMDIIKSSGNSVPDSIQNLSYKVSEKLSILKFEKLDRQDIDLLIEFTNTFNFFMNTIKPPYDEANTGNLYFLLKDLNTLLELLKASANGASGSIALPDVFSCDLSDGIFMSDPETLNSIEKIPVKLFALDDRKNVLKGIEVYFIAHGLSRTLPPDFFGKGSKDITTCFKFLNRMRYHVYLIDSKSRGKIASREIDLSDCKKEIEYYQKMGQNAITRYITIDSNKISQFLKAGASK